MLTAHTNKQTDTHTHTLLYPLFVSPLPIAAFALEGKTLNVKKNKTLESLWNFLFSKLMEKTKKKERKYCNKKIKVRYTTDTVTHTHIDTILQKKNTHTHKHALLLHRSRRNGWKKDITV